MHTDAERFRLGEPATRSRSSPSARTWRTSKASADLHDRPPLDLADHERRFGLWRHDGSPKPAVAEITARRNRPRRGTDTERAWLDITPDEFAADRRRHLIRLYERYRQQEHHAHAIETSAP